jgi:hypothetical protein
LPAREAIARANAPIRAIAPRRYPVLFGPEP